MPTPLARPLGRAAAALALTALALTSTPAQAVEEPSTEASAGTDPAAEASPEVPTEPSADPAPDAASTTAPSPEPAATEAPAAGAAGDPAQDTTQDTAQDTGSDPQAGRQRGPVRLRLKVANKRLRGVDTRAVWPKTILENRGVQHDRNDLLRVWRNGYKVARVKNRRLRPGDTVQLVVVDRVFEVNRSSIKPRTIKKAVSRLKPGQRKVVQKGRPGVARVTVRRTRHNWQTTSVDRWRKVVRKPQPRKVLVGQRFGSVAGADGMNWHALARCESGNNPRAVNPSGKYHGLYQFDRRTWASVGGSGVASNASAAEQTYRAKLLFSRRGRSPWPHCGRYL